MPNPLLKDNIVGFKDPGRASLDAVVPTGFSVHRAAERAGATPKRREGVAVRHHMPLQVVPTLVVARVGFLPLIHEGPPRFAGAHTPHPWGVLAPVRALWSSEQSWVNLIVLLVVLYQIPRAADAKEMVTGRKFHLLVSGLEADGAGLARRPEHTHNTIHGALDALAALAFKVPVGGTGFTVVVVWAFSA